ncbi:hypothetical protein PV773_02660 [Mesorhizobium sp. CC13]|uniref:hypothetical protein n=1 Tax=Mesorhizobium sp. CC13 TaxID=3029194 RepID=UPI0032652486
MSVAVTPFLRNALYVDALATGATALLAIVGAPLLAPFLDLPEALLLWAGLVLVPFVAMLVVVARRAAVPKLVLFDIVALNALWVIGSFALLATGAVSPNALGVAFVAAQALVVAVFAELQFVAIRRAGVVAA